MNNLIKNKRLTEMPYYRTRVSADQSKGEIIKLLAKYGIKDYQWTRINDIETLKFVFTTSQEQKRFVELQIPKIYYKVSSIEKEIPENQRFRIFYFALKGLVESTEFGFLKLEDVFYTNTLVKIGDQIKKLGQLNPKGADFLLTDGTN